MLAGMRRAPHWVFLCFALLFGAVSGACTDKTTEAEKVAEQAAQEGSAVTELDLWAGVPPLQPEADDIATELLPKEGPPKPKTIDEVVEIPFPAEAESTTPPATPTPADLEVLRYGPDGAQGVIDAVRVTFNQAMVPLASVEALRAKDVPITIDPPFPGTPRWLGTQTFAFVADGRVPFSTTYKIAVPAGTTATSGAKLDKAVEWTITTPTLQLESMTPDETAHADLEPTIVLTFNQPVQRVPLLAALTLQGGGKTLAVEEVPAPPLPEGATPPEKWQTDRILRLKAKEKLTPNTKYTLTIPAGVFGEGPDKSAAIKRTFSTYPPFKLTMGKCGTPCWASSGIQILSTTVVADPGLPEKVKVTPQPENMTISGGWNAIHISGDFEGMATYEVEVDPEVTDAHGQKLGKLWKGKIKLGPLYPELSLAVVKNPGVIERGALPLLPMRAAGIGMVEVHARALGLHEVVNFLSAYPGYDWTWPTDKASHTWNATIDVSDSKRKRKKFDLAIEPILASGGPGKNIGWLLARSEQYKTPWNDKERRGIVQMVQVTDLGISAVFDNDSGIVMVTRLSDNTFVPGAKVKLVDRDLKTELWSGITDTTGTAYIDYKTPVWGLQLLLVETEDDAAFMRLDTGDARGMWMPSGKLEPYPRPFFYTDRTPYKPGETIHLVGILRNETRGPEGGVEAFRKNTKGQYVVTNPRGIEVAKGEVDITSLGTLTLDIETKEEHGTGNYSFTLTLPSLFGSDHTFYHSIPVETYRTPEFEVKVERPESSPLTFGEDLVAEVKASYLHGAPLIGGEVTWNLTRNDSGFDPPGELNEGFSFGTQRAWWGGMRGRGRSYHWDDYGWSPPQRSVATGSGRTDAHGVVQVTHGLLAVDPPAPPVPTGKTPPTPAAPEGPPGAATYMLSATVVDANRQAIAGSGSFVVHAAEVYVGLRTDRTVLREGQQVAIEAVLVDLEGERKPGQAIDITVFRRVTERKAEEKDGQWTYAYTTKEEEAGKCALESRGVPVKCDVEVGDAGTYVVRGEAKDANGRSTRTETQIYVHGEDAVVWDQDDRRVDIVPDKKQYEPGQTANLLLRSPFDEAWGVVIVEREGISRHIAVAVHGGAAAVPLKIAKSMVPGVTVSAMLVRGRTEVPGAPPGQDLGMPAMAVGQVDLDISTKQNQIVVELEAPTEIEPKGTIELKIATKTGDGEALPASVAVMVVDEGVLSLMSYSTPDPLSFFVHRRPGNVWMNALHPSVLERQEPSPSTTPAAVDALEKDREDGNMGELGLMGSGPGGGGSGFGRMAEAPSAAPAEERAESKPKAAKAKNGEGAMARRGPSLAPAPMPASGGFDVASAMAQPVSLRTLFATTAFFDADVRTDAEGKATVSIPMPENLTTFRIMVVAVDPERDDRFGSADRPVRVRKPIMLRPALPRFANFGDAFEAGVMVDNQTGADQKILVGTRGLNVTIGSEDQKFVDIPAGESREVRFSMATKEVGRMRLQFAAMSNDGRDATEIDLPVNYPAVAEAFADYGMTEGSIERLVEPPKDVLPGFGGLELSLSSTAISGLEDAVQYLVDYEYECAEQTASRILPIFVLGDVLDQFPIATVRDDIRRQLLGREGIQKLLDKQNYDGGFSYWGASESWPYLTNWVTFALLEGKRAGFEVEQAKLDNALRYIENFVQYGYRTRWGTYYDWTSRAFGLWLLSREKKGDNLFDTVWAHRDEIPLYAKALLMSAANTYGKTSERDQILELLRDGITETARTVHFAESRSEAAAEGLRVLMHSNVQTDAVALMAMLEVVPSDPVLPKVMAGIMSGRDPRYGGTWGSTHSNAWALLSAARYFETVEKDVPDFTSQIWLDGKFGGELEFKGRSMAKQQQQVAMKELLGAEMRKLVLAKEGKGKLYYRLGLRYAPKDLKLPAENQGFEVHRTYEAIPEPGQDKPDPDAVKRLDDGSWVVKAGTNVKVTISLIVSDRANFVVVDDGLPAGFEGQNPRFVTSVAASDSATVSYGESTRRWWYPWWNFSHTDMRDDRMLLFADYLPAGVYTYSYTARATTIGSFHLPPIKAEAMYEPERFGHSASSSVRVVE